jgi:hypothetical protein
MTQLPEEWTDEQVLGFFTRHLVPIYFEVRRGGERRVIVWSAFPLAVDDRWLLMTAGHCIIEMARFRAVGGIIERARLMDGLNASAGHPLAVPFDYDSFRPGPLGPDPTFDYGILVPNGLAVRSMLANGVLPFTERTWDYEDREFEFYKLLGAPAAHVAEVTPDTTDTGTMFPVVNRLRRRPEGFERTSAPMFYGKVRSDPGVKLQGMSGGPILGFFDDDDGQHYRLVAMQVSTLREKYVSGLLMQPLARLLRQQLDERIRPRTGAHYPRRLIKGVGGGASGQKRGPADARRERRPGRARRPSSEILAGTHGRTGAHPHPCIRHGGLVAPARASRL